VIEVIGGSPLDPAIAALVKDLAEEALEMGDIDQLKVFWYFDDDLDRTAKDVLFESAPFEEWFPKYLEDNDKYWHASYVVVYSDQIPGRDELRFHVVLGEDHPTYALCVNRKTRKAQWYLQETPQAATLAASFA
jgi:hypothetical protein